MAQEKNQIDFRRLIRAAWQIKFYLLAILLLFASYSIYSFVKSMPKVQVEGCLLIGEIGYDSEGQAGGMSQMLKTFSVGGFSGSTVNNELYIIQSNDVMERTVRALDLNRSYFSTDKKGKRTELYRNTPVRIEAPVEQFDTLSESLYFNIELLDDNKVNVTVKTKWLKFFKKTIASASELKLPAMISTPYGDYQLIPADNFATSEFRKIKATATNNWIASITLQNDLEIDILDKMSDIIAIDHMAINPAKGTAIVNGVMSEYNAKRLDRLHETSIAAIKYYEERIAETFKDLQVAEKKVADYTRTNELMGIDSETSMLVGISHENKMAIIEAQNAIDYFEMVLRTVKSNLTNDIIIPQVENLGDSNIEAFNAAITERRNLMRSAKENNTALVLLNQRIQDLRDIIVENSEKRLLKARRDLRLKENMKGSADARLEEYPDFALTYKNLVRDREYINSLYQYLISQRENSVLQLYSNTNVGFVYQPAYLTGKSTFLKSLIKPVIIFIFGCFIALMIAIARMLLTRKISDPMDLARFGIDSRAVNKTDDNDGLERLRTMLLADSQIKTIYTADLADNPGIINSICDSFNAIGRSIEVITPASNDALLSPETAAIIASAKDSADYVIVNVPEPSDLYQIEKNVDADDAALLSIIPAGKIKVSAFYKTLKGQPADKVYSLIIK